MKQGKRPVRKRKELLKSRRLNAKNWLVERRLKSSVIFLHKESGNLKEIFIKKGKMLVEKIMKVLNYCKEKLGICVRLKVKWSFMCYVHYLLMMLMFKQ